MNIQLFVFGVFLLVASVMAIATSSIAIQCYNKCQNPDMNQSHPKNKSFLVTNLILSILLVFASFAVFQYAMMMPPMDMSALGLRSPLGI